MGIEALIRNREVTVTHQSQTAGFFSFGLDQQIVALDREEDTFHRGVIESQKPPASLSPTFLPRSNQEFLSWKEFFEGPASRGDMGIFDLGLAQIQKVQDGLKLHKKSLSELSDEWFAARAKEQGGGSGPADDPPRISGDTFREEEEVASGLAARNQQNRRIILVGIITVGVISTAVVVGRTIRG